MTQKKADTTKHITLRETEATYKVLKRIAADKDLTVSQVIRRAIKEYLKKYAN